MNEVKLTKEIITQKDLNDALASASQEIKPYLFAKRNYVNLSEDINKRLAKIVDNYQNIS